MFSIPNPLHPAIVHFPIVLILIGTLVAVIALILRRGPLPWVAAGLLSLGSLGALAAAWSGEEDAEMAGEISTRAESLLDEHEEWGETTRNVAMVAAVLAVVAAALSRFPRAALVLSILTVVFSLFASYCVAQTGHYGGQLVYKKGVGINTAAGIDAGGEGATAVKKENHGEHDD